MFNKKFSPNKSFQKADHKLKILVSLCILLIIGGGYYVFKSPSLTRNEQDLCRILHLENMYRENPKLIKCVLGKLSSEFEYEFQIWNKVQSGKHLEAAQDGIASFLRGGHGKKLSAAVAGMIEECRKYK